MDIVLPVHWWKCPLPPCSKLRYRISKCLSSSAETPLPGSSKWKEERPIRRRASLIVIGGIADENVFRDKVRPWACLDHPNIQSIYRMAFVSGWACLLAAPLSGNLLDDALEEESWTESRGKTTFLAVCQAVRHIHQQNFAHGRLDRESIYTRTDSHIIVSLIGIHNDLEASISTLQAKDFQALCQIGRTLAERLQLKGRLLELLTKPEAPIDTVSAIQEIELSWQSNQRERRKGWRSLLGS